MVSITIRIDGDKLIMSGPDNEKKEWSPIVKKHRNLFFQAAFSKGEYTLNELAMDDYQERAAIFEFDAGMERSTAEAESLVSMLSKIYKTMAYY